MTSWCRLWHDMPSDPKWRTISRKSGQPINQVISVYIFCMINASANATERGRTHNLFADDIGAALDLTEAEVQAILAAMKGKVMTSDGWLTGWEKRQPKREDNSSARAKAWRESQKIERNRTQPNAEKLPDSDSEYNINRGKKSLNGIKGNGKYKRPPEHGDKRADGLAIFMIPERDGFSDHEQEFIEVRGHPPKINKDGGVWYMVAGEASRPKHGRGSRKFSSP